MPAWFWVSSLLGGDEYIARPRTKLDENVLDDSCEDLKFHVFKCFARALLSFIFGALVAAQSSFCANDVTLCCVAQCRTIC